MLFFVMHGTLGVEDPMARQFEGGSIHLAYLGIPRAITSLAVPAVGVFYLAATGVAVARLSAAADLGVAVCASAGDRGVPDAPGHLAVGAVRRGACRELAALINCDHRNRVVVAGPALRRRVL